MGIQFNDTKETVAERTKTTNKAGGEAYDHESPELGLFVKVINNLLEDSYYESAEDSMDELVERFEECAEENPEFPLKLAKYARNEMGLRQVPQLLLVLSANYVPDEPSDFNTDAHTLSYVRDYSQGIMQRADEPLEVLAMQVELFGKSIPNPLQKGIEDALHNFNEYHYAKHDRSSREFRYRDLLNLVHPKPRDELRSEIFEKIAYGDLDDHPEVESLTQSDTWEDEMSEAGKDDDLSEAEVWREQLQENEEGYSMPIFARVRNVRNMLEAGLSGEEIFGDVTDDWVRNSKMFPFRFYQSYRAMEKARLRDRYAAEWLENAIDVSVDSVPDDLGNTYVSADLSGSMRSSVSNKSEMSRKEISALFGAICAKKGAEVSGFGTDFKEFSFHPSTPILEAQKRIRDANIGSSTNGWKAIKHLVSQQKEYDSVVLFTDMQIWDSTGGLYSSNNNSVKDYWDEYTQRVNPDARLYIIDLASYGDLVMPEGYHNVYRMSGWTEAVIDHIRHADDEDAAIQTVESVEPDN